jgi:hypothetical protein
MPAQVTVDTPPHGGAVVQFAVPQGTQDIPAEPPVVTVQAGTMQYTGWNKQVSQLIGGPITYSIFLCPQSPGCKVLVTLVFTNGTAGQVVYTFKP